MDDREFYETEYSSLKAEQLARIKQRDAILNFNVVGIGLIAAIAVQGERESVAWLVVPWISLIFGWAYLSSDDKVSAIARHLQQFAPAGGIGWSWEHSGKSFVSQPLRATFDSMVYVLAFLLPTPAAIALFLHNFGEARGWELVHALTIGVYAVLLVLITVIFGMSMRRRLSK